MIAEVGLLIALYVIARLTAGARPLIAKTTAGLAIAAALLVSADLAIRGFTSHGILDRITANTVTEQAGAAAPSEAAEDEKATANLTGVVSHADGGSITTNLGYGISVSKGSTLRREWITVQEPSIPVRFDGTPGVTTVYESERYGGGLLYRAKYKLAMDSAVRAFEVRFLLFDVWGDYVRSVSSGEVEDVAAGGTKEYTANWDASENAVAEHYASIGYVARVRLVDGQVIKAPIDTVLAEARRFSEKFTAEQLESMP